MSGKHNSARRSKAVSCYETGLTGLNGFQTQSLEGIGECCLEVSKATFNQASFRTAQTVRDLASGR